MAAAGYTYARGDARLILRVTAAHTAAWFVVMVPLLPSLGAAAVGYGWLAACLVDAVLLAQPLRQAGVAVLRALAPIWCVAVAAWVVGAVTVDALGLTWAGLLGGGGATLVALAVLLPLFARAATRDCWRMAGSAHSALGTQTAVASP